MPKKTREEDIQGLAKTFGVKNEDDVRKVFSMMENASVDKLNRTINNCDDMLEQGLNEIEDINRNKHHYTTYEVNHKMEELKSNLRTLGVMKFVCLILKDDLL